MFLSGVPTRGGQVKPTGSPSINLAAPLASGLLFYGIDSGDGEINDLLGNVSMVPKLLPAVTSTSFGKGLAWTSAGDNSLPGYGYYGETTAAIHTATDLSVQGTGAGFTVATTFYPTGAATNSLIFGRPAHANESAPFANWCIFFENAGDGAHVVSAAVNNSLVVANCGSYDLGAYNTLATAVLVVQNTAPGVATAKLYVQGTLRATTAGLVVQDTGPLLPGSYQDGEEQIQFGSVYHVDTGRNFNEHTGNVFQGLFASRPWTAAEALNFHNNPYSLLNWNVPNIILDTDMVSDCGDIGALQVAIALHKANECSLIGVVSNSSDLKSAPCCRTLLDINGLTSVPVGAYLGSDMPSSSPYTSAIVTRFGTPSDTRANYTSGATKLRQILAAQPDSSVTYVSVGFGTNIAGLLASSADGISGLTGAQLWAAKVKKFVVMGGEWPNGTDVYNFDNDKTSWGYVFANKGAVPTFFWGGAEGTNVVSGPASNGGDTISPSYYGYELGGDNQGGGVYTRPDWDQMAMFYAIRGLVNSGTTIFKLAGVRGTATFNSGNGVNAWSTTPGPDSYLQKVASDGAIGTIITGLMAGVL